MPKLKLLYVDDEPELCHIFKELFESDDIEIQIFSDPLKALENSRQESYDAALMDFRMHPMDGDHLAQELPASISKKFLLTGESDPKCQFSFDEILVKPLKHDRIETLLNQLLSEKRKI